jgi:hypothetical protein
VAGETPLNELLSHALLSLTRAYERTDPAAPTLPFYANVLRVVEGPGADFRKVAVDARISKRVAKTLLTEASHLPDLDKARALGAQTLAATEAAWEPGAKLRKPLEALVAQFDLEHPHFWMQYGAADMSAIGGRWPSHGTDWKPVVRTEPLGELPVSALLSAALMDFTIRYEGGMTFALAWTVFALNHFPDAGVAYADAPPRAFLSGDGRSTLERHGQVKVGDGVARLTDVGKFCRDAYAPNVARVEDEWRAAFGVKTVTNLRRALVSPKLEPDLADHPLLGFNPSRIATSR